MKNIYLLPEEDRKPKKDFNCFKCEDTGRYFNKKDNRSYPCQCLKEREEARKLHLIPPRFEESSFKNFSESNWPQPDGKKIILPKRIIEDLKQGYFFAGNVGTGKTHLLVSQYRDLVESGYLNVIYVREVDLIKYLQDKAYNNINDNVKIPTLELLLYTENTHIFIDDLGKTPLTEDRTYQLYLLIDTIYSNNLNLSITTNFKLSELERRWNVNYSRAIVRRLQAMCEMVYTFN